MGASVYCLSTLFEQLGLSGKTDDIEAFIKNNRLSAGTKVYEAAYWTQSQAALLKEGLENNSDWALIIDELNVRLHEG